LRRLIKTQKTKTCCDPYQPFTVLHDLVDPVGPDRINLCKIEVEMFVHMILFIIPVKALYGTDPDISFPVLVYMIYSVIAKAVAFPRDAFYHCESLVFPVEKVESVLRPDPDQPVIIFQQGVNGRIAHAVHFVEDGKVISVKLVKTVPCAEPEVPKAILNDGVHHILAEAFNPLDIFGLEIFEAYFGQFLAQANPAKKAEHRQENDQ
jgi:hypothetical protein